MWRRRISCFTEGVSSIGLCVSTPSCENNCSTERGKLGSNHAVKFSRGTWHQLKIRDRKGSIARNDSKMCASRAKSLRAKVWGEVTRGNLAPRKMRPRSSIGLGENVCKLTNADKATSHTSIEAKVMFVPTSKSSEEREFVVDSGASMHMMSKWALSSEELDTLRRSRTPTVVLTASGKVHKNEEAQVFVHDLKLFVTVQLHEETPAVLSLGKVCQDHRYSY